jgi:hypothetical protein
VNLDWQQAMVLPSKLSDSCKNNSAEGKTNNNNLELNLCFVLPETSLEEKEEEEEDQTGRATDLG